MGMAESYDQRFSASLRNSESFYAEKTASLVGERRKREATIEGPKLKRGGKGGFEVQKDHPKNLVTVQRDSARKDITPKNPRPIGGVENSSMAKLSKKG